MIIFSAPIDPVPFCRPAQSGRKRFNNPRYSAFKDQFALFALRAMRGREPFTGAIKITADFYKSRPKKTKHLCGDFAIAPSVVDVHGRKFFGKPHIEIHLEELR